MPDSDPASPALLRTGDHVPNTFGMRDDALFGLFLLIYEKFKNRTQVKKMSVSKDQTVELVMQLSVWFYWMNVKNVNQTADTEWKNFHVRIS
ncbi:hypothetical protein DYD21_15455 [Rhodohalobacter sp. SW132]|nr:hypothetical protein DYD21_15455 [Rhodohalobacter sp. SW132]